MEKDRCGFEDCEREAKWNVLEDDEPPEMFLQSCDEHLHELCDLAEHTATVWRIS